jgi:hypothetical protein
MPTNMSMEKSRVHLHLPKWRRGDMFNLSVKTGSNPVWYAHGLSLYRVKFIVSQAGHKRFNESGVKNVHAWVEGYHWKKNEADRSLMGVHLSPRRSRHQRRHDTSPLYSKSPWNMMNWRIARYNPAKGNYFYDAITGEPVHEAARAYVAGNTVWFLPYPHK